MFHFRKKIYLYQIDTIFCNNRLYIAFENLILGLKSICRHSYISYFIAFDTPQILSLIAYDATIILSNRCSVATPTPTIFFESEAVIKTEHVQSCLCPVVDCHCGVTCPGGHFEFR